MPLPDIMPINDSLADIILQASELRIEMNPGMA
jgi:hypothetical protein